MRLWSISPEYLDSQGLTAAWREGLLAQKVLEGKTRGYTHHPQLRRFSECSDPVKAIGYFLAGILEEAQRRGFSFDGRKIVEKGDYRGAIRVNRGQAGYELALLKEKLRERDKAAYERIKDVEEPELNRVFDLRSGDVEDWEKTREGIVRTMKDGDRRAYPGAAGR